MNGIEKIEKLVEELKVEADKLYNRKNKAAATRLRKILMDIKNEAHKGRADAQAFKMKIGKKR